MLHEINIRNFLCLRSVDAKLSPLTVLIGANDTGKSAFLSAIDCLFLAQPTLSEHFHWRRSTRSAIEIGGRFETFRLQLTRPSPKHQELYHLQCEPSAAWSARQKTLVVQKAALPVSGPPMKSTWDPTQASAPVLGSLGENLPSFFDYMLRRDRPRFDRIVSAMRELAPGFHDVLVGAGHKDRDLDFQTSDGITVSGERTSVGVRLLLYFVALANHPTPPTILLVEEPENGVHPRRLGEIMKLLRSLTKGISGANPTQVILSTHSPYLLDHVNPDTDQVLVFKRLEDGSRTCEPVNRERLKFFLDEFMLGEVWYNEGEEKLVQGPGRPASRSTASG